MTHIFCYALCFYSQDIASGRPHMINRFVARARQLNGSTFLAPVHQRGIHRLRPAIDTIPHSPQSMTLTTRATCAHKLTKNITRTVITFA
jgi:hypothetical protein